MFSSLLLAACFFSVASAEASSYVEARVPTSVPIAGNYTGALRPQVHFSPPKGFMNDLNCMFFGADGIFHLYYQCKKFVSGPSSLLTIPNNPTDTIAGNQHWGHATSRDLYHWENQKIVLFPASSTEGIFTGSAIIDVNNTSGFFPGADLK